MHEQVNLKLFKLNMSIYKQKAAFKNILFPIWLTDMYLFNQDFN